MSEYETPEPAQTCETQCEEPVCGTVIGFKGRITLLF